MAARRWRCRKCGELNAAERTRCATTGCRASKPRPRRRPTKASEHRALLARNRHLYAPLLKLQGGHCALCPAVPKPGRKLDLDHDHTTMEIRGLLCTRCNRTLRHYMKSEWMRDAAAYMEDPPVRRLPAGIYPTTGGQ